MKRFAGMGIVLLALCALLVLGASSKAKAVQVGGYCGGEGDGTNLTWSLDTKTGVLTISGTGKMADFVNLKSVPWASSVTLPRESAPKRRYRKYLTPSGKALSLL